MASLRLTFENGVPPEDDEDGDVLRQLRQALSKSHACDQSGVLRLSPQWTAIKDAANAAPREAGIYALGLPFAVAYDGGPSRILYLGSAKSLQKRLVQHRTCIKNRVLDLMVTTFSGELSASWWAIPGLHTEFLRAMEGEAIREFQRTYGTVPICNLDIPESIRASAYCRGLVCFVPDTDLSPIHDLQYLATGMNRLLVRHNATPHQVVYDLSSSQVDDRGCLIPSNQYRAIAFVTPDEAKATPEPPRWGRGDPTPLLDLRHLIREKNIAAWSVEKMREIISICRTLRPLRTKGKVMKAFSPPSRAVPKPHTWGEVALIMARMLAGTWEPVNHVWVRVKHDNNVLGEGKLNKGWYFGEHKSELPQIAEERPECSDFEDAFEPPGLTQNDMQTDYAYGVEITKPSAEAVKRIDREIAEMLDARKRALRATVEGIFQEASRSCEQRADR